MNALALAGRDTAAQLPAATNTGAARAPTRAEVAVALIGTGQVGGALLRRLAALDPARAPRLVTAANSRRALYRSGGLAAAGLVQELAAAVDETDLDTVAPNLQRADARHRVVIDATAAAAVAERHRAWLSQGIHVVTANKLALAGSMREWRELGHAQRAGAARYGDSATVGAGLPALTTLRRLVGCGDSPRTIEGVFSGSLSYLLNAYDGSEPFSALLKRARGLGYLEPDPRADLSGQDVARKLLILGRCAGFALEHQQIVVEPLFPAALANASRPEFEAGLTDLDGWIEAQRAAAASNDRVLRYVARLDAEGRAAVRLQALLPGHPCARLGGNDNLFAFRSERYRDHPLVIQGPGAGPEVTAQALLADLLEVTCSA